MFVKTTEFVGMVDGKRKNERSGAEITRSIYSV
jgi:hypothetical protein